MCTTPFLDIKYNKHLTKYNTLQKTLYKILIYGTIAPYFKILSHNTFLIKAKQIIMKVTARIYW